MNSAFRRKSIVTLSLILLGVVIGPFGTYVDLTLGQRVIYWACAIAGVGLFMNISMWLSLTHPELDRFPYYPRLVAASVVAALPGAVVIVMLEALFREIVPTVHFAVTIWFFVALIGIAVGIVDFHKPLVERQLAPNVMPERPATTPAEAVQPSKTVDRLSVNPPGVTFFRRLRPETGRSLVSLSINDHYLDIVTRQGRETILMRIAVAKADLTGYPGMRVHRSHWVAFDAVERLERDGNRWTAHMAGGGSIPVSRDLAPTLRDALAKNDIP